MAVIHGTCMQAWTQLERAHCDADLIELRLDLLDMKVAHLVRLAARLPVICTFRSRENGEESRGGQLKWLAHLTRAISLLHPEYVDLELPDLEQAGYVLKREFPDLKIVGSCHSFSPKNFDWMLSLFSHWIVEPPHGCDHLKLVCCPGHAVDFLRLFSWRYSIRCDESRIPLSVMAVGSFTLLSRILAPICSNDWVYAPTQQIMDALVKLYRIRRLDRMSRIYALIGAHVQVSQEGVRYHNRRFIQEGVNAVYVNIPIQPQELSVFFQLLRPLPFDGLSVTIPLKEYVVGSQGPINTLARRSVQEEWSLFNTDGIAALDLCERKQGSMWKKEVAIFGTGGVAKAIALEARKRGAFVTVIGRSFPKVIACACQVGGRPRRVEEAFAEGRRYTWVVQATSVGMESGDPSVFTREQLGHTDLLFEVVVAPHPTRLTATARLAQRVGCEVIDGYRFFKEQASRQQTIWHRLRAGGFLGAGAPSCKEATPG